MVAVDVIYLVFVNSDSTEGRGPMVLAPNSGFFTKEKEAWDFADTIKGIMDTKPASGSWRTEKYPHVEVRSFYQHDPHAGIKKAKIKAEIEKLQKELEAIK